MGERIERELAERGWSKSHLATLITGWTTTRVTEMMRKKAKGPTVLSVCALANALDVTTDYLLLGREPKRPSKEREPLALASDLAGDVRRQLYERLRWPDPKQKRDDRFSALTLEHLEVDGAALVARCVDECERQFRADSDSLLDDAHKGQYSERQAEVIAALVKALPLTRHGLGKAAQLANDFGLEAKRPPYQPNAETAAVTLTDAGVAALLPWWEWPTSTPSGDKLLRLAERTAARIEAERAR